LTVVDGFEPVSRNTTGPGLLISAHGLPLNKPVFPTVDVLYLAYLSKSVNTGMTGAKTAGHPLPFLFHVYTGK